METWTVVFILLLLSLASGFFSAVETALFSLTRIENKRLEQRHPHLARAVKDHLQHPRRTLMTLLIGNILVNTLAVSFATLLVLRHFGGETLGWAMALYTFFVIVFCEILPKIVAARQNQRIAALSAIPLRFFAILFWPLSFLMHLVTHRMMAPASERKDKHDPVSEEELKTLVKIGEEEGVFDGQERYMIQKLFDLGERPVKEIITPRVDMVALDIDDPIEKHTELVKEYHFSHFPVYKDSPDHILGVISVHEYLLSDSPKLEVLMKQPFFVPETKRIDELLEELRKRDEVFCVCVDEHGGTAGVVTLEDILEEIFGEYYDEYEKVVNPIRPLGHQEYIVDAKISVADFEEFFHVELETEEAATLGGFILEKMGKVPKPGEILETPELQIRIQKVIRQRILGVTVRKLV